MNDLERSLAFKPSEGDLARVRGLPAKELPSFAVVVPSFNQAKYLPASRRNCVMLVTARSLKPSVVFAKKV